MAKRFRIHPRHNVAYKFPDFELPAAPGTIEVERIPAEARQLLDGIATIEEVELPDPAPLTVRDVVVTIGGIPLQGVSADELDLPLEGSTDVEGGTPEDVAPEQAPAPSLPTAAELEAPPPAETEPAPETPEG